MRRILIASLAVLLVACSDKVTSNATQQNPEPDFVIGTGQTHNKFSRAIPPAITVPSGSVIEAHTHEATGGQLNIESTVADLANINFDLIHTLTGPIYVEGAEQGDVLAVELIELEPADWGWTGMTPDFGFLAGEHEDSALKTFSLDKETNVVHFAEGIDIPLKPFAGVMGVAPDTDEMLNTIPPRANGGNMDNPNLVAGTTVFFPVFVDGALFSIGDTHAVQGLGEVVGTAVESPMRILFRVRVVKGQNIEEPQYETDDYYATTGFATTIDEAALKATRYMIRHLVDKYDLSWGDAYMLCSLAGDLQIAEVVDLPHVLVAMHMPKKIFAAYSN